MSKRATTEVMSKRATTALQILERARDLIAPPNRWIQGLNYTTKKIGGRRVQCFCSNGAIMQASGLVGGCQGLDGAAFERAFKLKQAARNLLVSAIPTRRTLPNGPDLVLWNDRKGRTQEQVVRLFARAIARARRLQGA